jgi:hypothetical protein
MMAMVKVAQTQEQVGLCKDEECINCTVYVLRYISYRESKINA